MSELTVDGDTSQATGRPHPARLQVTSISQWLERFAMMAAIMVTRFPLKAPELFACQAMIVRAQRNYEGEHWVTYDRQFRREALARWDLNWSIPLYQEAFTGRARALDLPDGTLTGQSRYTRRPSQAGHGPSHGAHTAWPTITRPPSALEILIGHSSSNGSPSYGNASRRRCL